MWLLVPSRVPGRETAQGHRKCPGPIEALWGGGNTCGGQQGRAQAHRAARHGVGRTHGSAAHRLLASRPGDTPPPTAMSTQPRWPGPRTHTPGAPQPSALHRVLQRHGLEAPLRNAPRAVPTPSASDPDSGPRRLHPGWSISLRVLRTRAVQRGCLSGDWLLVLVPVRQSDSSRLVRPSTRYEDSHKCSQKGAA